MNMLGLTDGANGNGGYALLLLLVWLLFLGDAILIGMWLHRRNGNDKKK